MKINGEKGQVLPLVMIIVMFGALVIPPFLSHVDVSAIGSRVYHDSINAQYAADAGAEYGIWNLTDGAITDRIPNNGDTVSVALLESVNGYSVNVVIGNHVSDLGGYTVNATAGDRKVAALVATDNTTVNVLYWYLE